MQYSSLGLPRLALYPDAHVVGVAVLALVAETGVEVDHLVITVQSYLTSIDHDTLIRSRDGSPCSSRA